MNPNMTNLLRSAAFGALLLTGTGTYAYDADTLAFYPFCDYPSGTDVTKRNLDTGNPMTFTNAVDDTQYLITAEAKQYWGSLAAGGSYLGTTNDIPGRYLVGGSGYVAEPPIAGLYQAAFLRARPDAKSGHGVKLTLPGLASELSKYDNWTVECFIKVPTASDFSSWGYLIALDAGLTYDGNPVSVTVLPTAGSYEDGGWRVKVGSTYPIIGSGDAYNSGWMHIALVCTATELKFFVNYKQVGTTVTIAHAGSNEGQDLLINAAAVTEGSATWSGYVAGLRVKKVALTTDQMLHASESPTGLPETVFQWPLEGEVGASPTGGMLVAVANSTGIEPVLAERRDGTVYEKDVKVRETYTAVSLTGVPKTGASIYGSGNCIKVPKNSMEAIVGDFTMEAYVKFDYKTWMAKYAEGETRSYVSIFWQDWYNSSDRNVIWSLQLRKRNDIFYPCIFGYHTDWSSFLFEDFTTPIKMDNKWHHYAITYDYADKTFEVFEDGVSLGARTLTKQLYLSAQTQYNNGLNYDLMVGYGMACQPFEGLIDEVRYSRKILTPVEFISVDDRQGMMLIFR